MFNFEFKVDENIAKQASIRGGGKLTSGTYDVTVRGLFVDTDGKGNPRCEISLLGSNGEKIRIYRIMIAQTWKGSNAENFDYVKFQAFAYIAGVKNGTSMIDDVTKKGTKKRLSLNFTPNKKFKVAIYREYDAYEYNGEVKETDNFKLAGTFLSTGQTLSESLVNANPVEITTFKPVDNYTKRWKRLIGAKTVKDPVEAKKAGIEPTLENFGDLNAEAIAANSSSLIKNDISDVPDFLSKKEDENNTDDIPQPAWMMS